MAKFKVTDPQGKSFVIEGETAEGAAAAFKDYMAKSGTPLPDPNTPTETTKDAGYSPMGAGTVFADELLGGLPGKASAGLGALIRAPFTDKTIGEEYDTLRSDYMKERERYAKENPKVNLAATIGGNVMGLGKATGVGKVAVNKLAPGAITKLASTYGGQMAIGAGEGAAQGAATAFGHDQDVGAGAAIGGILGGAAKPVMDAIGSGVSTLGGMFGIGNKGRAQAALAEALQRSGKTEAQVGDDLTRAAAEGQPEYALVDALGNPGQRMLTGIAKSPGDARTAITENLTTRQAGQSDRLANALAEGFDAPTTAKSVEAAKELARKAEAGTLYEAARASAKPVNLTETLGTLDDLLKRDPILGETALTKTEIGSRLAKVRSQLASDSEQLVDFDQILNIKTEIGKQLRKGNTDLAPIYKKLDEALEASSPDYRAANDAYRQASNVIEAVSKGKGAASGTQRADDTIAEFGKLTPDEQQAFRSGYVDPQIAKVEGTAGALTNKARPLQTGKTAKEYPAFAAEGQADRLSNRIRREQEMFDTSRQALGGSPTAENLGDIADVQSFDPTMIGAVLSGNWKGAITQGLNKSVNAIQGRNQATRDMIAKALLQNAGQPSKVVADLAEAVQHGKKLTARQEMLARTLMGAAVPQAQNVFQD